MGHKKFATTILTVIMVLSMILGNSYMVGAQDQNPPVTPTPATPPVGGNTHGEVTNAERQAAAKRAAEARGAALAANPSLSTQALPAMDPGGVPDYFGTTPNWANSPIPASIAINGDGSGASATAAIETSGSGGTGAIGYITVTNGGSGYSLAATSVTAIGGGGSGAVLQPVIDPVTGAITAINVVDPGSGYDTVPGIRKFVDSLAGLGSAGVNDLGQYIPVATADTLAYPGSGSFGSPGYVPPADYYEIALVQYSEQLHKDLPPTLLREYVQIETANVTGKHLTLSCNGTTLYEVDDPHYLGPIISSSSYDPNKAAGVAGNGKPTRIKFHNCLPTGSGGNLFIPVDTTIMGAGLGPLHTDGVTPCDPSIDSTCAVYSQNRATLHLHGSNTPWISDGTPHQWTTPATEGSVYPEGVSVYNVPDMDGGIEPVGTLTFYYTNEQSARLMFYHDHAYGITRLNVYAGEAAGYLVSDPVEQTLISGGTIPGTTTVVAAGTIPSTQIPLIIQDKTFVPSEPQMAVQDPTWNWGSTPGTVHVGDLWFPHVYMTNQNPFDIAGVNAVGRWDYGPWFWPPFVNLQHGQVVNPLYPSLTNPLEGPYNPGTPNPSLTPEAFMDTPLVNGTVYPYLNLNRQAYRFRILNAANDRSWNLQLYCAKSNGSMWNLDGTLADANAGEVNMVPADPNAGLPASWPVDGRAGGVPDPAAVGPSFIQIGTEGGLMPNPAVLPNTPIGYNYNRRDIVVLNVSNKTLFLGPAERADVIVDFSQVPTSCSNLILYNDAPAPVPAFDSRIDYYTGDVDQTNAGGAPTTLPGYGPNTRTIMQIRLTGSLGTAYNLAALQAALPVAFAASQPAPIVPQADFNAAYGANYPTDAYARIQDTSMTFIPTGSGIDTVNLTTGGTGYLSTPTVNLVGGSGTGATAEATVTGGIVTAVTITNAGVGYTAGGLPSVVFSGGTPTTPAAGTAHFAALSTAINRVTVTSQGTGYTSLPSVDLVGGSGSGATAVASYTYGINTIAVSAGGSGYVTPGVAIIDPTGKGAAATATVTSGVITAVTVTNAGSGYTAPVIEFTGAGSGAVAHAALTSGILTITVTNGGFGYTSTGLPTVVLTGGGSPNPTTAATAVADVSVLIGMQPKAIQELFTTDYGRMNATLGVEIPNTTGVNQTTIPLGYIDPATEIMQNSNGMIPLGTLSDGTQIWKVTHNGVDTHAIHFHLFNVQLINRVGWDGAVRPPEANEIGWKEVVRMNPLEDAIVALRPIVPVVPWLMPNSNRPDDVTYPTTTVRTGVLDPLNLSTSVSNNLINFGWEYVWHCHLLGHEENDMMRPMIMAVPPEAPSALAIGGGSTVTNILLSWTNTSLMSTSYIVQRAFDPEFMVNLTQFPVSSTSFADTTNTSPTPVLYYRVLAANTVGGSGGAYPNDTALSSPSNTVSFGSTGMYLLTTTSLHGTLNLSASPSAPGPAYLNATNVTITVAVLESGWTFTGWSGDCSGTGSCVVAMSADRSVTANYTQVNPVISGNAGVAGATITYTGGSTTADGGGNYSFISSSNPWTGTVTPSLTGYAFTPVSRTYTAITTSQVAQNFTAAPITYTISGHIDTLGVSLSYLVGSVLNIVNNDSSGNYTLTVPYNWSGTVIPYRTGVIFTPANRPYTNVLAAFTLQDYARQQPTFADVPFTYTESLGGISYNLFSYVQALYNGGYTAGCSTTPLNYCPANVLTRAESAVFMLRAALGTGYTPPVPPYTKWINDNWALGTWARPWAEGMWTAGLTAGCSTSPVMFCPWDQLPREQAAVFSLRIRHGMTYVPPAATGMMFSDMTNPAYWSTTWMEQAYRDGLLVPCGTSGGKPTACPGTLIDRAWAAYMIVKAKNLPPVPYP